MNVLTTNEAAKRLGVSARRVRALIAEGKLEAQQLGREYAIDAAALSTVSTYGKSGRPPKAKKERNGNVEKPFKTIFDICPQVIGSVSSGIGDLSTNKKHLEGLGAKSAGRKGTLKRG